MISLRIIFVVVVLIELALAVKTQPEQIPRPQSPVSSDFWVMGARRPVRRAKRSLDEAEDGFDSNKAFEHLRCIQNIIDRIVTRYDCDEFWEKHRPSYINSLNMFMDCSMFPEDQIRRCQFDNFHTAKFTVNQFYNDLMENSKQNEYMEIASTVDSECRPDHLKV